ncbi:MAG: S-layer homology domain-containing protein [Firmicutes bacterium]|nr:S-layer homology domain-containing protein [Bacillota bacterium]
MRTIPKPFRLFFVLLLSVLMVAAAIPPLTVFADPAEYTIPAGQTINLSSIPDTADVKLAGSATIRIDCTKTLNSIEYAGSNYKTDTLTIDQMGPSRTMRVSGDVVVPNLTVDAVATSIYFEHDLYVQRNINDHGESGTALFKNGELHIWGGVYFGKTMKVTAPVYVTVGEGINTWSTSIGASYTQTGGTMLIYRGLYGGHTVDVSGGILRTGRSNPVKGSYGIKALYFRMSGGEVEAKGRQVGLDAEYDAEITGGTITATGTDNGSLGFYAQNYLKLNGGDFTATGTAAGCTVSRYTDSAGEAFQIEAPSTVVEPIGTQVKKLSIDTYFASVTDFWTFTNAAGTAPAKTVTFGEGYTVTFDLNGHGSATPAAQTVKPGDHAEAVADPSEEGWLFGGWYYNADCTGHQFVFSSDTITGNTTLYAKWTKQASAIYTVSYNTQGHGVTPGSSVVGAGGTVTEPTPPTAGGWIFGGWYKDASCIGTPYDFSTPVNSSFTLYAKWSHDCPSKNFTDVSESDWFHTYVDFAVTSNITSGTSATTFSPNDTCTRAQTVMFLWNSQGKPEPSAISCPFKDVKKGDWFYKAVMWAVENGITNGTSATTFSPNDTVTRGQVVTFLYAMKGRPAVTATNPFTDVKPADWFYTPVLFAVKNDITTGVTATTFCPYDGCTRAQIVTFIYRYITGFAAG